MLVIITTVCLRVEVAGGGDGSGKVEVEVAASQAGPAQYEVTADDGTVSTQIIEEVHAGDSETHIKFTYTPIETIGDGELQFTVPAGWSHPQAIVRGNPVYQVSVPEWRFDRIRYL